MLLALKEKARQGAEKFRYPDDMPGFTGPRSHAEWPGPTSAGDEMDFLS
jgi:carbon-monoxide dehydrogenase large subunit